MLIYHDWFLLYKMEFEPHLRYQQKKRYKDLNECVIKSSCSIKQLPRHFFPCNNTFLENIEILPCFLCAYDLFIEIGLVFFAYFK